MITKLTVDVNCQRPPWSFTYARLNYRIYDSKYRIYLNDELVSERTWMWDNDTIISEHILIESTDSVLSFKLDPVQKIAEQAHYNITDFKVNGQTVSYQGLEFDFKIA